MGQGVPARRWRMNRIWLPRHTHLPIVDYSLNTSDPEAIAEARRLVEQERALAEHKLEHAHGDAFCDWKDRLAVVAHVERFLEMLGGGS